MKSQIIAAIGFVVVASVLVIGLTSSVFGQGNMTEGNMTGGIMEGNMTGGMMEGNMTGWNMTNGMAEGDMGSMEGGWDYDDESGEGKGLIFLLIL